MKKILIINGHPNLRSYNFALAEAYRDGAASTGAHVEQINLAELKFNPNLEFGYTQRIELEPDLQSSITKIMAADHLVWVHPVWWGGFPSIMKGFIDRIFLPGITFSYRENSLWWDKLLIGKTARIITTLDQPAWYYWLYYSSPGVNQLKRSILGFCGVSPVKVTYIGVIKQSDLRRRDRWLRQIYQLGRTQG